MLLKKLHKWITQRFDQLIKPSNKQQTSHSNNFAEHNYNYENRLKTTNSDLLIFTKSKYTTTDFKFSKF